jgi:hypothetical protein
MAAIRFFIRSRGRIAVDLQVGALGLRDPVWIAEFIDRVCIGKLAWRQDLMQLVQKSGARPVTAGTGAKGINTRRVVVGRGQ